MFVEALAKGSKRNDIDIMIIMLFLLFDIALVIFLPPNYFLYDMLYITITDYFSIQK